MRKTIKVKLEVRRDSVSGLRYRIASLNGALTVADGKDNASPGQWIGETSAQRLVDSPRYDVSVVPENT